VFKLPSIDLSNSIFGAAQNINNDHLSVNETLFEKANPEAKQYIECCSEIFDTPFFTTLKEYLLKKGKGHSYI
jgi:hypothetical protein